MAPGILMLRSIFSQIPLWVSLVRKHLSSPASASVSHLTMSTDQLYFTVEADAWGEINTSSWFSVWVNLFFFIMKW